MIWFTVDIPRPAPRPGSTTLLVPCSLLPAPILAASCSLPTGMPEEVAILAVGGSTLARLLLREKNDVDCMGGFDVSDVVDVIDDLLDSPTGIRSFDSVGFSVCLADRKPNAPREAIVAAWLAAALNERKRR